MAEMEFSRVFWKIYDAAAARPRYISLPGGTRSTKTYSVLQFLHLLIPAADIAGDVTSVISETLPHLKRGAIRDFERIVGHPLKTDPAWNASDNTYTYPNGAKLEFFSADAPAKVLGPARKRLFINECNNISYDTALQLFVRTTGLVLLDYNPAASFWANEIIEARQECIVIHSTYKDNDFLSPEQVREIEANRGDNNWWKVYGLGQFGTLEGLIYEFDLVDTMPDAEGLREVWGLDFGFTNDPTAIVRILADSRKKEAWVQEICYRRGMLNEDIASLLQTQHIPRHIHIWADAAEPKSIAEIGKASGLNIQSCSKEAPKSGTSRLTFQVQWVQGWTLHFTKDSVDLIKEGRNYTWAKDRSGNLLNQPIEIWNHALDAMRYGLWTEFADKGGSYTISIL